MMLSGIGIFALLVTNLAQKRLQRRESRLKSKSDAKASPLDQESKIDNKNKIDGVEMLTEDDFDRLIIMMKELRHTLLEESKISFKCSEM